MFRDISIEMDHEKKSKGERHWGNAPPVFGCEKENRQSGAASAFDHLFVTNRRVRQRDN